MGYETFDHGEHGERGGIFRLKKLSWLRLELLAAFSVIFVVEIF